MVNLWVFNGKDVDDTDEIALGTPDQSEATDLNRHVERCAMRYRAFTGKLLRQSKDISQVKFLLYCLGAFILATSNPAKALIDWLAAHMK